MAHYRWAAAMLMSAVISAAAQDTVEALSAAEISTDRPDFTESTDTISVGTVQFEAGVLLSRHDLSDGPVRDLAGPQTLIRVGLFKAVELRLGSNGFTTESIRVDGQTLRHSGGTDPQIGMKVTL